MITITTVSEIFTISKKTAHIIAVAAALVRPSGRRRKASARTETQLHKFASFRQTHSNLLRVHSDNNKELAAARTLPTHTRNRFTLISWDYNYESPGFKPYTRM